MENSENIFSVEENKLIEYVTKKYNYNDELKKVLLKITNIILENSSLEERDLFYDMLEDTPIVLVPEDKKIKSQDLINKFMIGLNPHIINLDETEVEEKESDFVSEPILDESLKILGSKQFIYVKYFYDESLLNDIQKEKVKVFNSVIDVPNLIRNLEKAWVSQNNQFEIENGILKRRSGLAVTEYKLVKSLKVSNKFTKEKISEKRINIENSLNANAEKVAIAKYLSIDIDELEKMYNESWALKPSIYIGLMSDLTDYLLKNVDSDKIRESRMFGNDDNINKLNEQMEQTKEYNFRNKDTEEKRKKEILFSSPLTEEIKNVFDKYYNDFFPNKEDMSGIELLDNILKQSSDVVKNRTAFNVLDEKEGKMYADVIHSITSDGYILINQTADVIREEKENIKEENNNSENEESVKETNKEDVVSNNDYTFDEETLNSITLESLIESDIDIENLNILKDEEDE